MNSWLSIKKSGLSAICFGVCCACLLLTKCQSPSSATHDLKRAFYYWQTVFQLNPQEKKSLAGLQIERLYVRFFDVEWNKNQQQARPVAAIQFRDTIPTFLEWIPTIYITNEALQKSPDDSMNDLAEKIYKHLLATQQHSGIFLGQKSTLDTDKQNWSFNLQAPELQIDCDWTGSTQQKYFQFLTHLKTLLPAETQLSSTIRLHQIKFWERTGVPPVDRGLVMFYNMGKLQDLDTQNSILDLNIAKAYTERLSDYPLSLDAALPLFSWGVVFRDLEFKGLLRDVRQEDVAQEAQIFKKVAQNVYQVQENTEFRNYSFQQGDLLRIEQVNQRECLESAQLLSRQIRNKSLSLSLYHLNHTILQHYPDEELQQIFQAFEP